MQKVSGAIARLRSLTQLDVQADWRLHSGDLPTDQALQPSAWHTWQPVTLTDRQHIVWPRGQQVIWLGLALTLPPHLRGYPLTGLTVRLALTWWAHDAQIYVDGALVQAGDLFDCSARVQLRQTGIPEEPVAIALRLVSPGHDDGALVQSRCLYEIPNHELEPCPEPGFVADELAVVQAYAAQFAPERLQDVAGAIAQIDWTVVGDRPQFDAALLSLRQQLQPLGEWIQQRQISLLGHAHLDLAWLWPVSDTWDAAQRTFTSVLQLQTEFPELIFTHSSPALYAWIEEHRPDLFAAIQQQVSAGRWEVAAGLWVEPEFNTISGESIARQILYGQRYVAERFGTPSAIAWLPDSFGFCGQLPQLLRQGEIRYFVTQKLRWNDTNAFPHELFWWRSPAYPHQPTQSHIPSLHSAPIGEGIHPVKMADYAIQWEAKTGQTEALWLIGVGDHGGGPSRDMLHLAQRWGRSPFFPRLQFSTAEAFLDRRFAAPKDALDLGDRAIATAGLPRATTKASSGSAQSIPAQPIPAQPIPDWTGELYLEFHRGCYTSHADQKWWNRRCEDGLFEAEVWATMASQLTTYAVPSNAIETAWKQVLFNQFHDILPGSAVPEVYEDANREWQAALDTAMAVRADAMGAIAQHIALPPPPHPQAQPMTVFNPLNWTRSEVVRVPLPVASSMQWEGACVLNADAEAVPSIVESHKSGERWLAFLADAVPGVGYAGFWLCPAAAGGAQARMSQQDAYTLENEYLRVTVDAATGNLASVYDKRRQRQVLSGAGNELQAFADRGQYWDAWNIDPAYAQYRLPDATLVHLESVVQTPVSASVRVVRQVGASRIEQCYELDGRSPLLKIHTQIDWHETQVLLKAAFPLNLAEPAHLIREVPFGMEQQPTRPTDPLQQAKWEVPALRWAHLSEGDYGVSLLSDGKHGYDADGTVLRLSLLRRPVFPDPACDLGTHRFTYALQPCGQGWQGDRTTHHGYALNQPMLAYLHPTPPDSRNSRNYPGAGLPFTDQWLALDAPNVILSALKPWEGMTTESTTDLTLRCYECHGEPASLIPNVSLRLKPGNSDPETANQADSGLDEAIAPTPISQPLTLSIQPCGLLERSPDPSASTAGFVTGEAGAIAPWQVCTLRLTLS